MKFIVHFYHGTRHGGQLKLVLYLALQLSELISNTYCRKLVVLIQALNYRTICVITEC